MANPLIIGDKDHCFLCMIPVEHAIPEDMEYVTIAGVDCKVSICTKHRAEIWAKSTKEDK